MADSSDFSTGSSLAGTGISVGLALAQGGANPISDIMAVTALVGTGISLFGGLGASSAAKQSAEASQHIEQLEEQVNAQRQTQMNLESKRAQLQDIRNAQRARSMALSSASNQGAQFGSGLPGGYGQIGGQTNTNLLSNSQNTSIANSIFGLNNQIDQYKSMIAGFQGTEATDRGIASIGSAIASSSGSIGRMSGQLFAGGMPNAGASVGLTGPTLPGWGPG